jgi:2'-5' RNA ligase
MIGVAWGKGKHMDGIVSLLDDRHYRLVESLWNEFKTRFGVHGVHMTPVPHFSYHVAESYDRIRLDAMLEQLAAETAPFAVRTSGLGLFTGTVPVLYVPVVCSPALVTLHRRMYAALETVARGSMAYYHAENWQPHITLAHHDIDHDLLPQVIRLLSERDFAWEIMVDNLSVLDGSNTYHSLRVRFPFGGGELAGRPASAL